MSLNTAARLYLHMMELCPVLSIFVMGMHPILPVWLYLLVMGMYPALPVLTNASAKQSL